MQIIPGKTYNISGREMKVSESDGIIITLENGAKMNVMDFMSQAEPVNDGVGDFEDPMFSNDFDEDGGTNDPDLENAQDFSEAKSFRNAGGKTMGSGSNARDTDIPEEFRSFAKPMEDEDGFPIMASTSMPDNGPAKVRESRKPDIEHVRSRHRRVDEPRTIAEPQVNELAKYVFESAKKSNHTIKLEISGELPTQEFFKMLGSSFKDEIVEDVLKLIIDEIKPSIMKSLKQQIMGVESETESEYNDKVVDGIDFTELGPGDIHMIDVEGVDEEASDKSETEADK